MSSNGENTSLFLLHFAFTAVGVILLCVSVPRNIHLCFDHSFLFLI